METLSYFQRKRQTMQKQKRKKSEAIFRLPPNTPAVDSWVRAALFEIFRGFGVFTFPRRASARPPAGTLCRVLRKRKPLGSSS
jgi:hypothetical protein